MYVCMYVCVCVCVYIYIYNMCIHTHTHTYPLSLYIYIYIYYIYTIYMYIYVYIYIYYIYTIYMYIYVYIYILYILYIYICSSRIVAHELRSHELMLTNCVCLCVRRKHQLRRYGDAGARGVCQVSDGDGAGCCPRGYSSFYLVPKRDLSGSQKRPIWFLKETAGNES
jgi:hypothetical protein